MRSMQSVWSFSWPPFFFLHFHPFHSLWRFLRYIALENTCLRSLCFLSTQLCSPELVSLCLFAAGLLLWSCFLLLLCWMFINGNCHQQKVAKSFLLKSSEGNHFTCHWIIKADKCTEPGFNTAHSWWITWSWWTRIS